MFNGDDVSAEAKMHITTNISGVENMFTVDDMKLVDDKIAIKADAGKSIADKRKIVFSRLSMRNWKTDKSLRKTLMLQP